ncbi:hypothetical protein [Nesterenkonia halobia]|uniref:hypothetical protein n=1 Tax=Nesterenkonia halobia TaxID=37922 RepID=UPI0031CE193C
MVIGVVAGALIGIMIVQLIATAAPGDVPATERVLGGLFGGFIGGVIGAIPGIVLGAVIWLLEVRARLRAATSFLQRSLWEQREARRGELEAGRVSPDEAAQQIQGELEETWW